MIKISYKKMLNATYSDSLTIHQPKIIHEVLIPANLDLMSKGSSYILPSKIFLAISVAIRQHSPQ